MKISPYRVSSGKNFRLKDFFTAPEADSSDKKILKEQLQSDIEKIKKLQDLFFAYDRFALLLLFQGMDAAGKDGAIKHVMSGINPQGVHVVGFRAPSPIEYKHDFLWRHHLAMPERERIGIHNRSHYEFVSTCRVHPEYVLKENLPGIHSVKNLNKKFWKQRFREIREFEATLTGNNLVMLKFYLHLSKVEQKNACLSALTVRIKTGSLKPPTCKPDSSGTHTSKPMKRPSGKRQVHMPPGTSFRPTISGLHEP